MTELGTELPAKSRRRKPRDLYSPLNVLRTESKDDWDRLRAAISPDVAPKNFIEEMYVTEATHYTWEVRRFHRIKTGILNNAFKAAVEQILNQILFPPGKNLLRLFAKWEATRDNAYQWLSDPEMRRRVSSLLKEAGLDESALEAAAYRLVANYLEQADRMLRSAEDGRDKAFRRIANYRKSFADKLSRASDRVLAADQVPSIAVGEEN
jgi:hypothetical protein